MDEYQLLAACALSSGGDNMRLDYLIKNNKKELSEILYNCFPEWDEDDSFTERLTVRKIVGEICPELLIYMAIGKEDVPLCEQLLIGNANHTLRCARQTQDKADVLDQLIKNREHLFRAIHFASMTKNPIEFSSLIIPYLYSIESSVQYLYEENLSVFDLDAVLLLLSDAIQHKLGNVVQYCLDAIEDVELIPLSMFVDSINSGSLEIVEKFLSKGVIVNSIDQHGKNPLDYTESQSEIWKHLVSCGARKSGDLDDFKKTISRNCALEMKIYHKEYYLT